MGIKYSECVPAALIIQHAKRMHRVTLSSVDCPGLQTFSTLFHKRHYFKKKKLSYVYWTAHYLDS